MAGPDTPRRLADLVQVRQADEARMLEERVAETADAGAAVKFAALVKDVLTAWINAFGSLTAPGAGAKLAGLLADLRSKVELAARGLPGRAQRTLSGALEEATGLGARHAAQFLTRASGRQHETPDVTVSRGTVREAAFLTGRVAEQLQMSNRLLTPRAVSGSGWRGVLAGVGAARRAAGVVRQAVGWGVQRAVNDGAAQVADHYGALLLWVAEPTACVRCAAYSGHITAPGGKFPGGLSMDPNSRVGRASPIEGPPLHPNCRCRAVPWLPDWDTGPGTLPAFLRDQALLAVAAGEGRPSESRAARRRAAQALLAQRGLSARVRRQAAATAAGRT
ncbi:hypothetical protein [Streptomyces antibioticus]|uniref:hypothetical protein n=1 Tax=Streptomyces antibioticus TaxID=1890 RepID=UPI0033D6A3D7